MSNSVEAGGVMGFIGPCQPPDRVRYGFDLEVRKELVKPSIEAQPANSLLDGVTDFHPTRSVVRIGPGQYVDRNTGKLLGYK